MKLDLILDLLWTWHCTATQSFLLYHCHCTFCSADSPRGLSHQNEPSVQDSDSVMICSTDEDFSSMGYSNCGFSINRDDSSNEQTQSPLPSFQPLRTTPYHRPILQRNRNPEPDWYRLVSVYLLIFMVVIGITQFVTFNYICDDENMKNCAKGFQLLFLSGVIPSLVVSAYFEYKFKFLSNVR